MARAAQCLLLVRLCPVVARKVPSSHSGRVALNTEDKSLWCLYALWVALTLCPTARLPYLGGAMPSSTSPKVGIPDACPLPPKLPPPLRCPPLSRPLPITLHYTRTLPSAPLARVALALSALPSRMGSNATMITCHIRRGERRWLAADLPAILGRLRDLPYAEVGRDAAWEEACMNPITVRGYAV